MTAQHQRPNPSSKRAALKALVLLSLFTTQTLAQIDTCGVPVVFEPATLQNREPADISLVDNAQFETQIVDSHNFFRNQHGAGSLKWSDTLAKSSDKWVNGCRFEHSGTDGVGENLALGYSNVLGFINGWGLERVNYNFNSPDFTKGTGHFTQVVWKATTEVGCAKKICSIDTFADGKPSWLVVCQYQPVGNVVNPGLFEANVGKQVSGDPAVGISGTLSSPPQKTSASPTRTAPPVATIPAKTPAADAPDPEPSLEPDVVVITITVTEGADTAETPSPAKAGNTAKAPKSTSGPFWGRLKSSGTTTDTPLFNILRRRGGTARWREMFSWL